VVRRHVLHQCVWQDTIVGENALDQVIARLRRALDCSVREQSCIETLPRCGYRLIAVPSQD
jgi:DNA-binding winged helix-turn-helix (wHTH) protein